MTTATKAVNYTEEQTAKAIADYRANVPVEKIAEALGRTTKSVVAKLSREGVYVPKAKDVKTEGKGAMGKADLAAAIIKAGGMADCANDLVKLTKQTLVNLLAVAQKAQAAAE